MQDAKAALVAAKKKLLASGWCQFMGVNPDGRCCMAGAIATANFGSWDKEKHEYGGTRVEDVFYEAGDVAELLIAAIADLDEVPVYDLPWDAVTTWNDGEKRTFEQVVAVFDRAIELAETTV